MKLWKNQAKVEYQGKQFILFKGAEWYGILPKAGNVLVSNTDTMLYGGFIVIKKDDFDADAKAASAEGEFDFEVFLSRYYK